MRTFQAAIFLIVLALHIDLCTSAINSGKTLSGIVLEELPCQSERPCSGCGNGVCDYPAENCVTCPTDCGACAPCVQRCGNGVCEGNETSCSCPEDCGVCCVDGVCQADRGETFSNCAADCTVTLNISVVDNALFNLLPGSVISCSSAVFPIGPLITSSGEYSFRNIPPGIYECQASRFSYLPNSITIGILPDVDNITVRIPLGQEKGIVEGITTDQATNLPLENTQVFCSNGTYNTPTVNTNSRGEFVFPDLNPGDWRCFGSRVGYASQSNNGTLLSGGHVRIDLILRSVPASVAGYVTDSLTGTPVLAPVLACVQPNITRGLVGNDQGYFIAGNVDPTNITCTVSKDGYFGATKSAVVPPGVQVIMNFSLAVRPSFIFGDAFDSISGSRLINVTVTCSTPNFADRVTITNANGSYTHSNTTVGLWTCVATRNGWFPRTSTVRVLAGSGHYLPFILEPLPATLRGTVVNVDTQPVLQADVRCVFTLQPNLEPDLGPVQSNSTGQFGFDGILFRNTIPTLAFTCSATKAGYGSGTKTGLIRRGETVDVVIPVLRLGINVVVKDRDSGLAVAGATVSCRGPSVVNGTSAGDGSVLFDAIQVGSYTCSAALPLYDGESANVTIAANSGIVTVNIQIGLTRFLVSGQIVDTDTGAPLVDSTLVIRDGTGTLDLFVVPVDSTTANWSVRLVLPRQYQFAAENGPNYLAVAPILSLTPAQAANPIFIKVAAVSATITGEAVSNDTGASLPNCLMDLFAVSPSGTRDYVASQISDADGFFTFEKVNKGNFIIRATAEGYLTTERAFVIEKLGTTVAVSVRVDPDIYGRVSGRVVETLSGGAVVGVSGASVTVVSNSGTLQTVTNTTNSDGFYFFGSIVGGRVTATATKTGYFASSLTFEVSIGTTNTVNDMILQKVTGTARGAVFRAGPGGVKLTCNCFALVRIFPEGVPNTGTAVGTFQVTTNNPNFEFLALQEGRYYLSATDTNSGAIATTALFTVSASSPVTQDIVFA